MTAQLYIAKHNDTGLISGASECNSFHMNHSIRTFVLAICVSGILTSAHAAEDWKGTPPPVQWTAGGMAGLGVIDSTAGLYVSGNLAKKIQDRGFAPDINNQVFAEGQGGPFFAKGSTAFMYGLNLRWDFILNEEWTIYGLGGLGGIVSGVALGDHFQLFPRFAAGAFWTFSHAFSPPMSIRAELSHEWITAGLSFGL